MRNIVKSFWNQATGQGGDTIEGFFFLLCLMTDFYLSILAVISVFKLHPAFTTTEICPRSKCSQIYMNKAINIFIAPCIFNADDILNSPLFCRENQTKHFIWIICQRMNRINFFDKIREKMKLTSATVVVCSFRVNIISNILVYQYACAGLKRWCEKLDRKLLLQQYKHCLYIISYYCSNLI